MKIILGILYFELKATKKNPYIPQKMIWTKPALVHLKDYSMWIRHEKTDLTFEV